MSGGSSLSLRSIVRSAYQLCSFKSLYGFNWNLIDNKILNLKSEDSRFHPGIIKLTITSTHLCTICPGSSDPFYIVTYYIKWVTTSWTHSIKPRVAYMPR